MYLLQSIILPDIVKKKRLIWAIARKFKVRYRDVSSELERVLRMHYVGKVREIHIDEILDGSSHRDMTEYLVGRLIERKILEREIDQIFEEMSEDAKEIFPTLEQFKLALNIV